jgi:hypothetical protein
MEKLLTGGESVSGLSRDRAAHLELHDNNGLRDEAGVSDEVLARDGWNRMFQIRSRTFHLRETGCSKVRVIEGATDGLATCRVTGRQGV